MTRRSAVMLLVCLALAATASAQMGPGHGSGSGMPGMPGSGNGGVGTRFGNTPSMSMAGMQGMELPVASDGTVFVVRRAGSSTVAFEIAAVRPSGAIGWTYALENASAAAIEIVGTNLVVASHAISAGTTPTAAGRLFAISLASGAKQWTLDLEGPAMALTPHAGGLYALVVKPSIQTRTPGTGMSGMSMERKLVSVGNDGKVAWTLTLD